MEQHPILSSSIDKIMLDGLLKMIGYKPTDYNSLMQRGAAIIDVRTKGEFNSGHLKGSVNIPLNVLESNLKKIDKSKPVITCCASGMRSASAKSILKAKGYDVVNGGSWDGLSRKINRK